MIALTLAQMRRSMARLVAAGLAVALGSAFVTATLLAGQALTETAQDAVTTQFGDADLVLSGTVDSRVVTTALAVPGVASVHQDQRFGGELTSSRGSVWAALTAAAEDPRLRSVSVVDGTMPAASGQVVLPVDLAGRLGVEVGEDVELVLWDWRDVDESAEVQDPLEVRRALTVVGTVQATGPFATLGPSALVTADELGAVAAVVDPERADEAWLGLVALDGTRPVEEVRDDLRVGLGERADVRTVPEEAERALAEVTGSTQALTAVVLGFAAVALLVAGLVITNTFTVLVAQRTRTLALLRCVGADRRQLRRSVLVEATLLGGVASTAGVVLGVGGFQVLLAVVRSRTPDVPVPTLVAPGLWGVVVPIAVGVVVTVLAALAPARAATRVAPLAALRPQGAPTRRAGRLRAAVSLVLLVGGLLGLGLGIVTARFDVLVGLMLGVAGGAASFVGIAVGAVFWVPWMLRGAGRVTASAGPTARLASANAVRNPRRTAATSAALLIGVTLVSMMSTGAAVSSSALDRGLDERYPVDVAVQASAGPAGGAALPAGLPEQVAATDGIAATALLRTGSAMLLLPQDEAEESRPPTAWGEWGEMTVLGGDPEEIAALVRDPRVAGLDDGVVVVSHLLAEDDGLRAGDAVALRAEDGSTVTGTAVIAHLPRWQVIVPTATLAEIAPDEEPSLLWASLEDVRDADAVVSAVADIASTADAGLAVEGSATERAFYGRVISSLLTVVLGLLAVSIVIAVLGVANTLALSVLERRRESATLRAVGMSRRQLRGSLAVEGVLVAAAGTVAGVVLGVLYGWVGAQTVLAETTTSGLTVPLTIPWSTLLVVVAAAVAAGALASVLPARTAARTSPVAALTVD